MSRCVLGLYEKSMPNFLNLPEKLHAARSCGYEFLELSIDETEEKLSRLSWSGSEAAKLVQAMDREGIPISSICLSGHRKYPLGSPDPAVQARSLEIMADAVRLAACLGVRIIQLAGYDVYYQESTPETRDIFARNLERCVELASAAGVMLAFETMETPFMNTVSKAMEWVARIGSPYLQIYPDAGNITNACLELGVSVEDDLTAGRGHLAAVHLKESRPGVFREVPYGTGHVDFDAVVKTSAALGVRRFLAEFWYVGQEDWRADLAANQRFLRRFLDRWAG